MTVRIPLVINTTTGQVEQLQSGDTLVAPSSLNNVESLQNGDSVTLPFGTAVYLSAAGVVKRTNASAVATSAGNIGLVADPTISAGSNGNVCTSGLLTGTITQWDAVITGDSTGLQFGSQYFLDPITPGNITTTCPNTVGQVVVPLGIAQNATTLKLNIGTPILL